ncbi:pyridoxal phosphate-dependent transferase [Penicillium waksmanii]|uniref:pyridoxal phosphate-dependent transferase n=1 Tax=Penicillium waksmanii TaxID=69791 RepID=UPI002548ADB2|nr:pyridoxal phosphate-dependent transferase [Penicillium waksmanii]KAJ6001158.1 pyridoxal phosphate-dependent transferase [Penicillium waksmanii]
MEEIFSYGFRVGHPRFFSVIPSPSCPESWIGETITSAFNPFSGSQKAGTGVCAIEKSFIAWICEQIGLPSSAGGHFVSGASVANLTALIVARDQMLGEKMWRRERAVGYISDQTHFCVRKALGIIGFSDRNIRVIESNSQYRMDATQLSRMIDQDLKSGNIPFVIVGTCGTTNTGSIDPLEELAEIADKHNIWLHIDAAYGGSVAFSKTYKGLVAGLRHANSISWDAHKWLFQVHGCGAVLFRERTHPLKSFASSADVLASIEDAENLLDPWNYGIELTRPARHMPLWFSLQSLGMDKVDAMISRGFYLAKLVETELRKLPHWKIISPADMGIITFRYVPKEKFTPGPDLLSSLISKRLEAEDIAIILTTRLKGMVCLRMCTINPRTQDCEIRQVVKALDQVAKGFEHEQSTGNTT